MSSQHVSCRGREARLQGVLQASEVVACSAPDTAGGTMVGPAWASACTPFLQADFRAISGGLPIPTNPWPIRDCISAMPVRPVTAAATAAAGEGATCEASSDSWRCWDAPPSNAPSAAVACLASAVAVSVTTESVPRHNPPHEAATASRLRVVASLGVAPLLPSRRVQRPLSPVSAPMSFSAGQVAAVAFALGFLTGRRHSLQPRTNPGTQKGRLGLPPSPHGQASSAASPLRDGGDRPRSDEGSASFNLSRIGRAASSRGLRYPLHRACRHGYVVAAVVGAAIAGSSEGCASVTLDWEFLGKSGPSAAATTTMTPTVTAAAAAALDTQPEPAAAGAGLSSSHDECVGTGSDDAQKRPPSSFPRPMQPGHSGGARERFLLRSLLGSDSSEAGIAAGLAGSGDNLDVAPRSSGVSGTRPVAITTVSSLGSEEAGARRACQRGYVARPQLPGANPSGPGSASQGLLSEVCSVPEGSILGSHLPDSHPDMPPHQPESPVFDSCKEGSGIPSVPWTGIIGAPQGHSTPSSRLLLIDSRNSFRSAELGCGFDGNALPIEHRVRSDGGGCGGDEHENRGVGSGDGAGGGGSGPTWPIYGLEITVFGSQLGASGGGGSGEGSTAAAGGDSAQLVLAVRPDRITSPASVGNLAADERKPGAMEGDAAHVEGTAALRPRARFALGQILRCFG